MILQLVFRVHICQFTNSKNTVCLCEMVKNMKRFVMCVLSVLFVGACMILPLAAMDTHERMTKKKYSQAYHNEEQTEAVSTRIRRPRVASSVTRLSTSADHVDCLREGISSATRSILMTSYGVNDEAFVNAGLYPLLSEARTRGVNVYVYNIDSKDIEPKVSRFFDQQGIRYDVAFTHAKLFAVDECIVAIGSYSWLARENTWENATLRLSGRECADLVPLLWKDLKYYRHLQFGNARHIEEYEDDSQNYDVDTWNINRSTTLSYIHTLESHQEFIAEVFKSARRKIIMCSPFVSYYPDYQEDFTHKMLNKALRKNVHVYFVCRSDDRQLERLRHYLRDVLVSPFMHLVTMPSIHLKTVVADDELIAEGSFNWLSASRDEESEAHNHEVTFVLDGEGAAEAIRNFYASLVGQEITRMSSRANIAVQAEQLAPVFSEKKQDTSVLTRSQRVSASPAPRHTNGQTCVWKISEKGNSYSTIHAGVMDQKSHHIVIIKGKADSYSAVVDSKRIKTWHRTEEEAKKAALDSITTL